MGKTVSSMTTEANSPLSSADQILKAQEELVKNLQDRKSTISERYETKKKELKEKYQSDLKELEENREKEALEIKSELEKLGIKSRGRKSGSTTSKPTKRKKRIKLKDDEIKDKLSAFMGSGSEYKCDDLFNHLNIARQDFMDFLKRNSGFLLKKGSTKSTRYLRKS
jgi:hypothetical protein